MRDGPYISPEDAALEAFAEILAKKRGGTWVPVLRPGPGAIRKKSARREPQATSPRESEETE